MVPLWGSPCTLWSAYTNTRWLGSVTVGCRTYDWKVMGSTFGRVVIKWLLLGWVTLCGHVNHVSIYQYQRRLSLPSFRER